MKVALYTPGWPAEVMANGITSYAAALRPALLRAGAECFIIAHRPRTARNEPYVSFVLPNPGGENLARKAYIRLTKLFSPHSALVKTFARGLLKQVQRLEQTRGLDVFEM